VGFGEVRSQSAGGTLDFLLNEEQLQLKKSVREFAEREIAPNVMKWDEAGEFPLATIKELGKLGLLGTVFPVEYGGAGMGYVEYVTAIEELSRVDGSVGIIVAAHTSLCSNHIFLAGGEAQKKKYVSKLATGEYVGAWGLTEPSSGSDAEGQQLGAERHQDVLHQWPLRGRAGSDRGDRSGGAHAWAVGVHRGKGREGFSSWEKREQAGAAGERHGRTHL
jgi:alkylation response protein AidB-like acyl-CoA dehydrogenase